MSFKIILKVTKSQGFTLFLEDTIFEKPQGEWGFKLTPPAILGLKIIYKDVPKKKRTI